MSFWKNSSSQPKRNYRWLVSFGSGAGPIQEPIKWWAKTVNVPSFDVSEVEHNFLDNKYYYPGRVSWTEITLTLVDPAGDPVDTVAETLNLLSLSGYKIKDNPNGGAGTNATISKNQATQAGLGDLMIEVLDPNGTAIETWNLNNVFIKAAKFGDLDYSNDELRTIEMTIRYDWAHCTLSGGPNFNPIN